MGFVNERDEHGKWRTIDHERGLLLQKKSGPSREGTYEFEFKMNEQIIYFSGVSRESVHGEQKAKNYTQYNMNWYFNRLSIPPELQSDKEQILEEISNALEVYGWSSRTQRAHSVSVTFKPELLA